MAKEVQYNPVYNIQNVGVLGDVTGSNALHQQFQIYSSADLADLREVVSQVQQSSQLLDDKIRASVSNEIEKLLGELETKDTDSSKIRLVLSSLKSVCEGASGNLVANGIIALIGKFI